MNVRIHQTDALANAAAANLLCEWLTAPGVRNVMLAAGNSPLALYGLVAERRLPLSHLNVFALDEYVGVPLEEPRNCANLLGRHVADDAASDRRGPLSPKRAGRITLPPKVVCTARNRARA